MKRIFIILLFLTARVIAVPLSEGELILKLTQGERSETHRYRIKQNQLRIDQPGEIIPSPPVNIVNLKTNEVILLQVRNGMASKFIVSAKLPATNNVTPPMPPMPPMPLGIGAQPSAPGQASPSSASPSITEKMQELEKPVRIGPDLSKLPGTENLPEMPEHPKLLDNMPTPIKSENTIPQHHAPQRMPIPIPRHDRAQSFQLESTDEKKEILGFSCQKFTLKLRRYGELRLWLIPQEKIFTFHRLHYSKPRNFGRPEWQDQLASLLRAKKLFPLLITMHPEQGNADNKAKELPELLRWEVTSYNLKEINDEEGTLFSPPESFQFTDH